MRKSDKLKNFKKVNLLAEQRYLQSKGLVTESSIKEKMGMELIMAIKDKAELGKDASNEFYELQTLNPELYNIAVKNYGHLVQPNVRKDASVSGLEEANAFDDYEQEYNQREEINYISPERKSEIETLANTYELSGVKSDKGVGGTDPVTYFRLEFYKMIDDRPKYFWVNIIKDDVKINGKENLQNMIPDENQRHQFMMDVKNLVNSILENELA